MGIPSYFSYIKKRYDTKEILHKSPSGDIENLFLDLNGIIHPCCHKVLKEIEGNGLRMNTKEIEEKIYEGTIDYILEMVEEIRPKEILFIGIDGVAPRAKMFQQRKRRFKSQQDKRCDPELKDKEIVWDTNAITPGTGFMHGLNLALKNSERLKEIKRIYEIRIVISDSQVASEGEHKILQYIKKEKPHGTCVIHGLDADLIMLSMLCYPQNIYLFRHDNEKKTKYYFHVNTFVNYIKMHFDSSLYENVCEERIIDEYTFLCFFMGNDFLPHHYGLEISDEGIDYIIEKYCIVKNQKKDYFATNKDGTLNTDFLCEFMGLISQDENDLVEKRMERMVYKNVFRHGNKGEDRFKFWPDYNREMEKVIKFGSGEWKNRYYNHIKSQLIEKREKTSDLCNDKEKQFIENMTVYYLQGLVWNYNYYKNQCVSDTWYYPYLHAPCLIDIYGYLSNKDVNINDLLRKNQRDYSCFEQLLFVLPPKSFGLLPISWMNRIKKKEESKRMFPEKFELDPIGSIFRWQCAPILPFFKDEKYLGLIEGCRLSDKEEEREMKHQEYNL
jgi:5'-3' exonuclease